MALIKTGRAARRPGYRQRVYVLRSFHGRTIAQSWPRARGIPVIGYMKAGIERMRIAQRAVKTWAPEEQRVMDKELKSFMRRHRGVQGTAAIRLRDWLTQIIYGRAFQWTTPDGKLLRTAAMQRDASDWLDWSEPRLGSLLTRTDQGWLPTIQCRKGLVLTQSLSIATETCCEPASIPDKRDAMGGYP